MSSTSERSRSTVRATTPASTRACAHVHTADTTYSTSTTIRTCARASKSTPCPGVTVIPDSRSAALSLPLARAASIACCWVMPAGSRRPMTPSKMIVVALPRSLGPSTARLTPATARTRTTVTSTRSGPSRRRSRRADGQKSIDFSAGMPALIAKAAGPRVGGGRCGFGGGSTRCPPCPLTPPLLRPAAATARSPRTSGRSRRARRADPDPPPRRPRAPRSGRRRRSWTRAAPRRARRTRA